MGAWLRKGHGRMEDGDMGKGDGAAGGWGHG